MAPNFTEFVQLERNGKLMFESDLFKLTKLLGRPAPEFKRGQIDTLGNGNLCWLIESSVHGNIKAPGSKTLIFTTVDANWDDGLCCAMQRLLARLVEEHKEELANSPFRFYGRRDVEGRPTSTVQIGRAHV